jgi:hypothetical protein
MDGWIKGPILDCNFSQFESLSHNGASLFGSQV